MDRPVVTAAESTTPPELPLLLGARADQPEMLLLIGTPGADGQVPLRRWTAADWSAPPRLERELAATLLRQLEQEARAGRAMNQSLYAVQRWLRGDMGDEGGR